MLSFGLQRTSRRPLRILCLGAHSDDIEIGCGGTILKLIDENRNTAVSWVVFSSGSDREREAQTSAEFFLRKAKDKTVLVKNFRNGFFPYAAVEIKEFFEELKSTAPDLIFTHYRDDRHQDHRLLSDLTWNTFRNHLILEYEIPKYDGDLSAPNCFVGLDEKTCGRKVDLILSAFRSQRDKHWFNQEVFRGLMRLRAMEAGGNSPYAEGFYVRKLLIG